MLKRQNFVGYYAPDNIRRRLESLKKRAQKMKELLEAAEAARAAQAQAEREREVKRYGQIVAMRRKKKSWSRIADRVGLTRQGVKFVYDQWN